MTEFKPSRKQVHFWVSEAVYKKWDEYRMSHGFSSLSVFITHCVNNQIYPLTVSNDSLMREVLELKEVRTTLENDLQQLLQTRDIMLKEHQMHIPKLEYRILDYLDRAGPANEYLMAQDLNEQASEVYHACAYLASVGSITQDEKGNWIKEKK